MRSRTAALTALSFIFLLAASGPLGAQTPPPQKPAAAHQAAAPKAPPVEKAPSVTKHTVVIDGKAVAYTATVGEMMINKPNEEPGAFVFYVAYTRDDARDKSARPLTFAFNGGPGSSSVWLHLGGLGPRRVAMDDEGISGVPPYGLADNPFSIIDVTDLVMIDPVSTGYSRPLPGENKSQFHGLQEDAQAVGEFIRLYVTKNERWASPKFLLGESYGTTRSAALSGVLQGRTHGMFLNGIILVSSVLDFATIRFAPGDPRPYVLFLPHYTATAWYHKKLPADLQSKPLAEVLDAARAFALDEYLPALLKGNRLSPAAFEDVARKTAAFSGLRLEYVKQSNLKVPHSRFVKELMRDEFRSVGRLDSRILGRDAEAAGDSVDFDPSSAALMGSFSTRLNHYLRTELKYEKDIPYAVYGDVYPWNFSMPSPDQRAFFRGGITGMPDVTDILRQALAENPHLRVFCANGYYDGATPFFGTEYTFAQIGFHGEFKDRVEMGYYEAGHMMYIHKPSIVQFKKDIAGFIAKASAK
ncbi:MAG: peptidase S10 [Candidatus Aminicenantes bacterium]